MSLILDKINAGPGFFSGLLTTPYYLKTIGQILQRFFSMPQKTYFTDPV